MSIKANKEALIDSIQDGISVVAGNPPEGLGDVYQQLTEEFQALGICNYILDLDTDAFYRNLLFSVYAWRFYLRKCQEKGIEENIFSSLSRTETLFDAIVCQRLDLVAELDQLSPKAWSPKGEYQENYYYYAFVYGYVLNRPPEELKKLAEELEACVEGNGARHQLCVAISEGDKKLFRESFDELMDAKTEEGKRDPIGSLTLRPGSNLSVEGTAWLLLAKRAGISVKNTYTLCPQPLLDKLAKKPDDADIFLELEKDFKL